MRRYSTQLEWIRENFLEEVLKVQVTVNLAKQKKKLERKHTS